MSHNKSSFPQTTYGDVVAGFKMNHNIIQISEISDMQGNVYAYKCPECKKVYSYQSIAEDCLKSHAQLLLED